MKSWIDYLAGVEHALILAHPHGPTPMQVLDVAMRFNCDPVDRLAIAAVWRCRFPSFKPTKRQLRSITEDWGLPWPVESSD